MCISRKYCLKYDKVLDMSSSSDVLVGFYPSIDTENLVSKRSVVDAELVCVILKIGVNKIIHLYNFLFDYRPIRNLPK